MRKCSILLVAALFLVVGSRLGADECNIRNFGAVGDGTTVNTAAIQKAIDACRDAGGGRQGTEVQIDGLRGDAAPSSPDKAPVRLRDGKGGRVENVRPARER